MGSTGCQRCSLSEIGGTIHKTPLLDVLVVDQLKTVRKRSSDVQLPLVFVQR